MTTEKKSKGSNLGTIVLLIIVMVLVVWWLLWRMGNTPLENIYIDSKFSTGDLEKFQIELEEIEAIENYTWVVNWARKYDYLWYPGKAIIIYENWMETNEPYRAIYNNVGKLYAKVCEVEWKVNKKYCENALENFNILIETYNDGIYYLNISEVYRDLWLIEDAKENYKLYYQNTNGREIWFEEEMWIDEKFLNEVDWITVDVELKD